MSRQIFNIYNHSIFISLLNFNVFKLTAITNGLPIINCQALDEVQFWSINSYLRYLTLYKWLILNLICHHPQTFKWDIFKLRAKSSSDLVQVRS